MLHVSPIGDNADTSVELSSTGLADRDLAYEQWVDDSYRCTAAEEEAELVLLAAQADRELAARLTIGTIDPATAPALAALIDDRHGRSDFYTVESDGRVVLARRYYDLDPTELAALRGYVEAHNAAGKPAPKWSTAVGGCAGRKPYLATVVTPTGRTITAGKFKTEAEAWDAANARLMVEKLKSAA